MTIHTKIKLASLRDVQLLLPVLYSESSQKVYDAALNKVVRLTGKSITHFAADENAWTAGGIIWAGAFGRATPSAQKAAFEAWV